jgi:hypothetical protein
METQFIGIFTIGQTLDRGFRLYKAAIKKIFLLLLLPCLVGVFQMTKMMTSGPGGAAIDPAYLLLNLLNMLIWLWVWIIATRYLHEISKGENLSFGKMLRLAGPKDLLYIITYFIFFLILVISLFAVIPFIYLINISYIAAVVCIIERKYFLDWVGHTFTLTKGRWWKTFVINLIVSVITFVPIIIVMFIWTGAMGAAAYSQIESLADPSASRPFSGMSPLFIFGAVLYMLAISLVMPIFMSVNVVHYNSLRAEKENIDIDKQLDDMDAAEAGT